MTTSERAVLVQRIAQSSCLILSGAETDVYRQDIEQASEQLSANIGAEPVDPENMTIDMWTRTYAASGLQLAYGDQHTVAVQLLFNGMDVLTEHHVLGLAEQVIGKEPENRNAALVLLELEVSSQIIKRDLCLLAVGISSVRAQQRIGAWVDRYSGAVDDLLAGNENLGFPEPPNIQAKLGLKKLKGKMTNLQPLLEDAAAGLPVQLSDLQIVGIFSDSVLNEAKKVRMHYP